MKTIPPSCPEPEIGPKYWRGLDELADSPEFKAWAEREFPAGASELGNDFNRRDFVKIMSASFLLAGFGLTGCRRPEEHIYPFGKQPENYIHGVPQYYATAMPTRSGAIPLVVKAHEGRPIKVEGNASHPDSNGGTDGFAQASVLGLYDPDRSQRYTKDGNATAKEGALDFLNATSKQYEATQGKGLSFLLDRSSSPSRARLLGLLAKKFPQATFHTYEAVDFDVHRQAATLLTGKAVAPYYKLSEAKAILSLDCDFAGSEDDSSRMIRGYAKGRKIAQPGDSMNRLYVVEALMTLTGANADHRLRVPSSLVVQVAAQIAVQVLKLTGVNSPQSLSALEAIGAPAGVKPEWITECAKDLVAHKGHAVVLAGHRQPLVVHLIAQSLNAALGGVGTVVEFRPSAPAVAEKSIVELAGALNAGSVETLVILGGNPAYDAPADLNWSAAQAKAGKVIRLAYYEDETFALSKNQYHYPAAHYLESWGDARTADGTVVPVQPLIEPLFGGLTEAEFLARLAGVTAPAAYDVVRETIKGMVSGDFEAAWKKFLYDGYLPGTATAPVTVQFNYAAAAQAYAGVKVEAPSAKSLEVIFHRDYSVDDGRFNNNGWLQELPDPITKLTWDNAVLISRKTSVDLGLKNRDVVSITLQGRKIEAPVWVQPGQADNTLGLALGYGRTKSGRVGGFGGQAVGFNAYPLRSSSQPTIAVGAQVAATGASYKFATTQEHWSMEGRPIVREANLKQFEKKPDFARNMDLDAHAPNAGPIYQHPYDANPEMGSKTHQWGMSIDLNSCMGCSACVIACQSENNIPIVGKDQVSRSREMHWIRIDRYYAGGADKRQPGEWLEKDEDQYMQSWIDDPQVVNQPMLCQHCKNAPCESVCPVNATVHDEEGLNLMAYNRCIGTRYCSNNCAYKVRRFNFFDYNKRPLEHLYKGPLATRPKDEWELTKMVKNPDVTVRMRGVMEKCTFCIQRIEQAKISQKVKAGASGDVQVPDGAIKTACEQACSAEAIVFGNILDPESRVSKLKKQTRDYSVLGFLDTQPRLTYLAKVRNPNPAMPDFRESPLSMDEYSKKMGDPFESHHGGGHGHDDHGHGAADAHHGEAKKGAH